MREATHKQNSILFQYTGCKFWLCEPPHPTVKQASEMIDLFFSWSKAKRANDAGERDRIAVDIYNYVRKFFPDWELSELRQRYTAKKKNGYTHQQDSKTTNMFNQKKEEEKKEEKEVKKTTKKKTVKKVAVKQQKQADNLTDEIISRIKAGQKNLFLSGPAGCGKTVTCNDVAKELDLPIVVLSCNAGTSPAEITGFKYPEPRHSAVTQALPIAGIVVFDEITTLDPAVCASANALLANNKILSSMGEIIRHEDCIIIATSNLLGDGRDRQYISNNQLDAATMDRFIGGIIRVDYSEDFESQYDAECKTYIDKLRSIVKNNGIRKIVSTRALQAAWRFKTAGKDWKNILIEHWTQEEKAMVC